MLPSKLHFRYIFTYVYHFCVLNNTFIILLDEKSTKRKEMKRSKALKGDIK